MKNAVHRFFDRLWYGDGMAPGFLLWPLGWLVRFITVRKRNQYLERRREAVRLDVPVIVVGNITVGGTGKTPLVVWLVHQLRQRGYRPGIVSRGYGGRPPRFPYLIKQSDVASVTGDEPLMLARRTGVPVVIDPRRANAAQALLDQTDCDIIISDDGLQHYGLGRSYEIIVLDGSRGVGNGRLLPAGPLREPLQRLYSVNAVVVNGEPRHASFQCGAITHGFAMAIVPIGFRRILDDQPVSASQCADRQWIAVAGIGNPQRFFDSLRDMNILFEPRSFPDHHVYSLADFAGIDQANVLTTEKDAVKLRTLGINGLYLSVEAQIQPDLIDDILASLERFKHRPHYCY